MKSFAKREKKSELIFNNISIKKEQDIKFTKRKNLKESKIFFCNKSIMTTIKLFKNEIYTKIS